ncbi:hypothetical protein HGO97_022505 [Faecalicatena sp. AGMB00832]|uniref:Uncharacterized protein n=1 Tax=Faecalicatena faecalis TaxID=2726362 RepID=A0ABS6DAW3_9FIRM|nr:DUF6470 family protein [Faecalicatena faecalis]MBU3878573.1 hypothetical protein [Faecalicatena faecalis]
MDVLRISTTPIQLSMSSQRARLESKIPDPEAGIINQPGRLEIRSENIKVNIDTFDARQSMGYRTGLGIMKDSAQAGTQAAGDATAQYAKMGNQLAQIQNGVTPADVMKQFTIPGPVTTGIKFIPSQGPDISWEAPDLDIDYTPGKVEFEPKVDFSAGNYVPGKLEVNVEQFPKVEIEYVADPLYVPPRANPNYEE